MMIHFRPITGTAVLLLIGIVFLALDLQIAAGVMVGTGIAYYFLTMLYSSAFRALLDARKLHTSYTLNVRQQTALAHYLLDEPAEPTAPGAFNAEVAITPEGYLMVNDLYVQTDGELTTYPPKESNGTTG